MKIAIMGITHDGNRVKASANVEYDCLIAPVNLCSIPVSVEYVEGKSLEQYTSELKETALGITRAMYDGLIDNSAGKASSAWSVKLNEKGRIRSDKIVGDVILCSRFAMNGKGVLVVKCADISGSVRCNKRQDNEMVNKEALMAIYELSFSALKSFIASQEYKGTGS